MQWYRVSRESADDVSAGKTEAGRCGLERFGQRHQLTPSPFVDKDIEIERLDGFTLLAWGFVFNPQRCLPCTMYHAPVLHACLVPFSAVPSFVLTPCTKRALSVWLPPRSAWWPRNTLLGSPRSWYLSDVWPLPSFTPCTRLIEL